MQDFNYWAKRRANDSEKDWIYGEKNWLQGYVLSIEHPHRQLVLKALKGNWSSLLEIGCNVGPNLALIREKYEDRTLFGLDANPLAIKRAKEFLPSDIVLRVGSYYDLPYPDKFFDVILADATLMYAGPIGIDKAMSEIDRVAKKTIIIVDRFDKSLKGKIVGHVWGRNYTKILEKLGFKVEEIKITKEIWPTSKNWIKYGRLFVCQRA